MVNERLRTISRGYSFAYFLSVWGVREKPFGLTESETAAQLTWTSLTVGRRFRAFSIFSAQAPQQRLQPYLNLRASVVTGSERRQGSAYLPLVNHKLIHG
jgi:hypothetical protein